MKTMTLRYPGDPPYLIELINREEFFKIFPPEQRKIIISDWSEEGDVEEYPMGTTICCDFCNEDPGDFIALVRRSRAYCEKCYKGELEKYCS